MKINLNSFERIVRVLLGLFSLFSALVFFHNPLAQIAVILFGLYSLGEGVLAKCPLALSLGVQSPGDRWKPESLLLLSLSGIQMVQAYVWWSAGWEKISGGTFVSDMPKTLGYFASKNPFSWYKDFLLGLNSEMAMQFGIIVEWSQAIIAICLVVTMIALVYSKSQTTRRSMLLISILALMGGMVMSANFYLAAGWTGPGTKTSNIIMFWTQGMLCYAWISLLLSNQLSLGAKKK